MEFHLNIGTNMGDRERNLARALELLRQQLGPLRVSSVVESEPWGYASDKPFLNQGVAFKTYNFPQEVLRTTQLVECMLSDIPHREADGSYRDREVDIDIVAIEGSSYAGEELQIPHRHLEERPFFLEPLRELRERRQIVVRGREVLLCGDEFPTAAQVTALNPKGEIFRVGEYEGWEAEEVMQSVAYWEKGAPMEPEETVAPEGCRFVDIREAWSVLGDERWSMLSRVAELCYWDRETRFCGRCGGGMERAGDVRKVCRECGAERFPRLAPAIVVLVLKGDEALLVHARTFRPGVHALVAGFVETGENLEQTVKREIKEETGMEVDDLRYFGSQSWPFPAQLMVAFTARWVGGEPRWVDGELTAGAFFRRDALPPLPSLPSLSRRLIDAWVENRL